MGNIYHPTLLMREKWKGRRLGFEPVPNYLPAERTTATLLTWYMDIIILIPELLRIRILFASMFSFTRNPVLTLRPDVYLKELFNVGISSWSFE